MMKIFVTGGVGFIGSIGSAVICHLIRQLDHTAINLDTLTYAGNLESLTEVESNPRYSFEQVDIWTPSGCKGRSGSISPMPPCTLPPSPTSIERSTGPQRSPGPTSLELTPTLRQPRTTGRIFPKGPPFRFHHVSIDEVAFADYPKEFGNIKT